MIWYGKSHNRNRGEYLWEIVHPRITVNWHVTVTSTGWPHMKLINENDWGDSDFQE